MKMIVRFTVVFAILLLLNGVASAACPDVFSICYEVTVQDVADPENTHTDYIILDFCPAGNYGDIYGINHGPSPYGTSMILFSDTRDRAIIYDTRFENCNGFLEFHGGLNGFTGLGYCVGERHEIKGHRVDWSNCNPF